MVCEDLIKKIKIKKLLIFGPDQDQKHYDRILDRDFPTNFSKSICFF